MNENLTPNEPNQPEVDALLQAAAAALPADVRAALEESIARARRVHTDQRRVDVVTIEIMGVDTHYRAGAQACSYVGDNAPENVAKTYKMVADMHEKAKAAVKKMGSKKARLFNELRELWPLVQPL